MNDADWLRRRVRHRTREGGGALVKLAKFLKKLIVKEPEPPPPPPEPPHKP